MLDRLDRRDDSIRLARAARKRDRYIADMIADLAEQPGLPSTPPSV